MKKTIIILLCLALTCTVLASCNKAEKSNTQQTVSAPTIDITDVDPININGLDNGDVTDEQIQSAMGREPDAVPVLDDGSELQLFNNVNWLNINYKQVQYSRRETHMLVTYCYSLETGETMEDAIQKILDSLTAEYGQPASTVNNSEAQMYTWHSDDSANSIRLYRLTETEIRLQYTLPYEG